MLKLKQQYFGHLRWRVYSLENTLILGKIECRKRRGWQRMEMDGWHHWVNEHEFEQLWDREGQGSLGVLQSMGSQRIKHESDWTNRFINILKKKKSRRQNVDSYYLKYFSDKEQSYHLVRHIESWTSAENSWNTICISAKPAGFINALKFEKHWYWWHPQLGIVFALAPSLNSFWSYFSIDLH